MTKKTPSGSNLAPSRGIKISPRYHVFSTFVVVIWGFLIIATIIIHERGVSLTCDPSQPIADQDNMRVYVPWIYSPGTGLAGILRTAFTQAHGPITSMHLARLAVGVLEVPRMSPRTWMEVFWLADRRWAGPFGLGKTGWTVISRRIRVSIGLILLATLNVVAIITPIVMTRAYPAGTRSATPRAVFNVSTFDLTVVSTESLASDQLEYGLAWWRDGQPAPVPFWGSVFAELGVEQNESNGAWLLTADLRGDMFAWNYAGIRVAGGCETMQATSGEPLILQDMCQKEFGSDLNPPGKAMAPMADEHIEPPNIPHYSLVNVSSCSNVNLTTAFGHKTQSSAIFRMWFESGDEFDHVEIFVRCSTSATPGIGYVGPNMTFGHFSYTAPSFDQTTSSDVHIMVDPIAAIVQSDILVLRKSLAKMYERMTYNAPAPSVERLVAATMWDGVLWMSTVTLVLATRPVRQIRGQTITSTGIWREMPAFYVLMVLLGIWFIGMIAASAVFLRPAWTGTLDGYAVARMLQYHPIITGTRQVWFSDLEQNKDMLEQFTMHEWRSKEVSSSLCSRDSSRAQRSTSSSFLERSGPRE